MGAKKEYDNANTGALFVNDKGGNDKRPDFTGKLTLRVQDFTVDGEGNVLVYLAAWKRESDRVGEFFSIKASAPEQK